MKDSPAQLQNTTTTASVIPPENSRAISIKIISPAKRLPNSRNDSDIGLATRLMNSRKKLIGRKMIFSIGFPDERLHGQLGGKPTALYLEAVIKSQGEYAQGHTEGCIGVGGGTTFMYSIPNRAAIWVSSPLAPGPSGSSTGSRQKGQR
ncbi:MAG: hypothetical protein Ct9H300mP16_01050 [Pseudomonadota bacterium]|nr:MAG: hypothetical protein Ct9H300mP16_01050 [Pseudomonadota bacterium]